MIRSHVFRGARPALALSVGLVALLHALPAAGDAVPMPPEDCPPGTRGDSSHCGTQCLAHDCVDDDGCPSGMDCREQDLCVLELECMNSGGPFTREVVRGACGAGGSCAEGSCERLRVCVDPDDPALRAGCSCRAGGPGPAAGAALVLAGVLVASLASRRRRAR